MNRKERRAKLSLFKKQLKGAKFDEFFPFGGLEAVEKFGQSGIAKKYPFQGFYKNSIFSVQVYSNGNISILGIRRHDEGTNVTWAEKQKIKNQIAGGDTVFMEFYPREEDLVDVANMYWLITSKDVEALFKSHDIFGGG